MNVLLPEDIERLFTADDLRLALALGLFLDDRVTLGQGAAIAGLSQSGFLRELGKRRIPVHYDEADALADAATVAHWDNDAAIPQGIESRTIRDQRPSGVDPPSPSR